MHFHLAESLNINALFNLILAPQENNDAIELIKFKIIMLQNINDISISEFTDCLYCIYDDLPFAAKLEVLDITACILRGETAYDEIEFVSFICETNLDYFLNMICYHLENQIECI